MMSPGGFFSFSLFFSEILDTKVLTEILVGRDVEI